MTGEKVIKLFFVLLIISSTIVLMNNQEARQAESRQAAFTAMDRLTNDDSITFEEAKDCAVIIHRAVETRSISYSDLGVGSRYTIEEMVKHVEWGWRCTPDRSR